MLDNEGKKPAFGQESGQFEENNQFSNPDYSKYTHIEETRQGHTERDQNESGFHSNHDNVNSIKEAVQKGMIARVLPMDRLLWLPASVERKYPTGITEWSGFSKPIGENEFLRLWDKDKHDGVCIVCGAPSNNLEVLDIDAKPDAGQAEQRLNAIIDFIQQENPELAQKLVVERSQSGGYHIFWMCASNDTLQGNMKLARKKFRGERAPTTLIETRGQGGLILTYPNPGYEIIRGTLEEIPVISNEERDLILRTARAFNEYTEQPILGTTARISSDRLPGEDFNNRGDILPVLKKHGWKEHSRSGGIVRLTRPGKETDVSASLLDNGRIFYPFSTNIAVFEPNQSYTAFAAYAFLEHDRDFSAAARDLQQQGYGDQSPSDRTSIYMPHGEIHEATNRAEQALAQSNEEVYQRGGSLIEVRDLPEGTYEGLHIRGKKPTIQETTPTVIGDKLNRLINFYTFDGRSGDYRRTKIPGEIPQYIQSRAGLDAFPTLRAIIQTPTLRPDGTILSQPGYDPETGILFRPNKDFGDVVKSMSVGKAIEWLDYAVSTFPFVSDVDRAVAIAEILTPLVRPILKSSPILGNDAPRPRTGKTMLTDVASIIATGEPITVMTQSSREEENEKRLQAALYQGETMINIDNATYPISGVLLSQMLTQQKVAIRPFNQNQKIVECPTVATGQCQGSCRFFLLT